MENASGKSKSVKKAVRKKKVAGEKEILSYLSKVLQDDEDEFKASEKFKAAELLGKYYGLFGDKQSKEVGDVIIVDNIPEDKNGASS